MKFINLGYIWPILTTIKNKLTVSWIKVQEQEQEIEETLMCWLGTKVRCLMPAYH